VRVSISSVVGTVGSVIDAAGVAIIVGGAAVVSVMALVRWSRHQPEVYRWYRQQLGRSILLGLELLVAGDIIRTADAPTLTGVVILAGIVLIRTVLSFSLEVEITGRWPWQSGADGSNATPAPTKS